MSTKEPMKLAVDGLVQACETMFMVDLKPEGDRVPFDPSGMYFGGRISVLREDGCWDLALFGTQDECRNLTRAVYLMEDDEEPSGEEIVDALGELVNMAAGALKKEMGSAAKEAAAIPLFFEGDECKKITTWSIPLLAQKLTLPEDKGAVFFVWSERTSKELAQEILAGLGALESLGAETVLAKVERDEEDIELLDEFLLESSDELDRCEEILGLIQNGETDPEFINEFFRKIHSIKGVASCCQLHDIANLTHITEEIFSDIRDGEMELKGQVLESVYESNDLLRKLLVAVRSAVDASTEVRTFSEVPKLVAKLEAVRANKSASADLGGEPEPAAEQEPISVERDEEDLELMQEFIAESVDECDRCEEILVDLQEGNFDPEHLNELFRRYHSVKGVASCCELEDITHLTHTAEELLSDCREGKVDLGGQAVEVILETNDLLRKLVEEVRSAISEQREVRLFKDVSSLVDKLELIRSGESLSDNESVGATGSQQTWILADLLSLYEELLESLPQWADESVPTVVECGQELVLDLIHELPEKLGVFVAYLKESVAAVLQALETGKAVGDLPELPQLKSKTVQDPAEATAPEDQKKAKDLVKVDTELLTELDDLCTQLASLKDALVGKDDSLEGERMAELSSLSRQLTHVSANMRLVEIKPVFQKMGRMVRDLAKKTEKMVKLIVIGEETLVDRKMAEKVSAPLVHMIRNAVDHGLETPATRQEADKAPLGTIKLKASSEGKSVVVEITDDGKGIDRNIIFAKAVSKGLVEEEQSMTDREVFNLIFHPGFSTAAQVTSISGRGVGMDVVRRDIESLGGHIEIDSTVGKGSIFKMVVPLISSE